MIATSAPRTRVMWSWQSNSDPWNEVETKEWQRYSDLEIELIEGTYQKKEKSVELGDYVIDFKQMIQFRKGDEHRQRRLKRKIIDVRQYLREERFGFVERPQIASQSFKTGGWEVGSRFTSQWNERNQKLYNEANYPEIVEQAAKGILKEGQLLSKEFEGQLIADKLRQVKDKTFNEIIECCARLYSMESFLYKLVNTTMRNEDFSKIDTLGAYCFLLWWYLQECDRQDLTVYRGCQLSDDMIEDYKKALGICITWLSYTSTSKSRQQAEQFGNTLFIIRLRNCRWQKDISSLSYYPDEEEILLQQGFALIVDKVEYDEKNKKYFIYLSKEV